MPMGFEPSPTVQPVDCIGEALGLSLPRLPLHQVTAWERQPPGGVPHLAYTLYQTSDERLNGVEGTALPMSKPPPKF
jgi:hypothetical protein